MGIRNNAILLLTIYLPCSITFPVRSSSSDLLKAPSGLATAYPSSFTWSLSPLPLTHNIHIHLFFHFPQKANSSFNCSPSSAQALPCLHSHPGQPHSSHDGTSPYFRSWLQCHLFVEAVLNHPFQVGPPLLASATAPCSLPGYPRVHEVENEREIVDGAKCQTMWGKRMENTGKGVALSKRRENG